MFRNYLKIAVRSLRKNSAYVLINTLGLGMALACGIIAYLNYDFASGWDQQNENFREIYRIRSIRSVQGSFQPYGIVPNQITSLLETNTGSELRIVRTVFDYMGAKIDKEVYNSSIIYVDPAFFDMFTTHLIDGNLRDMDQNAKIVVTASAARKFFGNEPAVGKVVEQVINQEIRSYEVVAVIDDFPMNSSFADYESIALIDNYRYVNPDAVDLPWTVWNTTFIQAGKDEVANVSELLSGFIPAQNKARPDFTIDHFEIEPLKGMAARARDEDLHSHPMTQAMPKAAVVGTIFMAGLLLLLACFNYTNISIAMSGSRLKEIGLRKVMGGVRKQLVFQFILENILMTFIAMCVGIVIAELLIPVYNDMWDFVEISLVFRDNFKLIGFLFLLVLCVGLLAGSYPAFYVSSFEATPILRGTMKVGGNTWLSKALLVMQLSISLIALVAAFAFLHNAEYQRNLDYGFNRKNILVTFINGKNDYDEMKAALEKYPDIDKVSGTEHMFLGWNVDRKVSFDGHESILDEFDVGEDFFDMLEINFLSGEGFSEKSVTDEEGSILVNETFVKYYGLGDDVIGKKVMLSDTISAYIKGVTADTYFWGFWSPIEPTIFRMAPEESYQRLIVKADEKDLKNVNEEVGKEFRELFPNRLYNSYFLTSDLAEAENVSINVMRMFAFLGAVALLLSITGLYAMVALNILKRTKEIGIRKVLGASVGGLVKRLNLPYLILIIMAIGIGCFGSYYLTDALLDMIWVYHANLPLSVFVYASGILLFVTGVTITFKVVVAALGNPVTALRSE